MSEKEENYVDTLRELSLTTVRHPSRCHRCNRDDRPVTLLAMSLAFCSANCELHYYAQGLARQVAEQIEMGKGDTLRLKVLVIELGEVVAKLDAINPGRACPTCGGPLYLDHTPPEGGPRDTRVCGGGCGYKVKLSEAELRELGIHS